jgi:hypothetical protein
VNLANEAHRDGQLGEPHKPVIHGGDVVHHLIHILGSIGGVELGLGREQVL